MSSGLQKILCIIGTRPEVVKMAPVVLALRRARKWDVKVLTTAQHRKMLDQALELFGIVPNFDLNTMRPNQTLADLTSRLTIKLDTCLKEQSPDLVLAQGDTTTVMVAALASFYRNIPFGHIEAGLRTHDFNYPWPEEMNRVVADRLASINFAPTQTARDNLLSEGIAPDCIHVTGNTVIDALFMVARQDFPLGVDLPANCRLLLVTTHRRENFGAKMVSICQAVTELARKYMDLHFLLPVHPNPNVQSIVNRELGELEQVSLCQPLDYGAFVTAMKRAYFILTDSGGVQEEAPALAKPVLVLRDETERPEAVQEGVVEVVGTQTERIVQRASLLLDDEEAYRSMAKGSSPYGDGKAANRIVQCIEAWDRFA